MTDLLRKLLDIRDSLHAVSDLAGDYGYLEGLPELPLMQELERRVFVKVNEWSAPDPPDPPAQSGEPGQCMFCRRTRAQAWEGNMGLYCEPSPEGVHVFAAPSGDI